VNCITPSLGLQKYPKHGLLCHSKLGEIIIWRQHEFHTWWQIFETSMQHPLSRTLINAAVDSLEIHQYLPTNRGIFWKKKFKSELNDLLSQLGWGRVEINEQRVVQSAHPLLSVAVGQYAIETYHQSRYKVRWIEPRSQIVQLELEPTSALSAPQRHNPFPWSTDERSQESGIAIDLVRGHSGNELQMEGERVLLIPTLALERFLSASLPYAPETEEGWFHHTIDSFVSFESILKITIKTTASMFLRSEQPVYIIDRTSWESYVEHYLVEAGWGHVTIVDYNDSSLALHCNVNLGCNVPFTIGMICGLWERAHGRSYKINIQQNNDIFSIEIESLLQYQNQ